MIDRNALRTNQVFIILLTGLAFVADAPVLVLFVALVMLLGTAFPQAALFQQIYFRLLRPRGFIKPDVVEESSTPHRFAQGMGGLFLLVSYGALKLAVAPALGWTLALLVIALALINLALGLCAGCFIYFQLERFGLVSRSRGHV